MSDQPNAPQTQAPAAEPATAAQKRKTVHLTRLSLTAPSPNTNGEKAVMWWAVFDESPRLVVKTNDPNDSGEEKEWGKITAKLDLWDLGNIVDALAKAVAGPNGFRVKATKKNSYRGKQHFDAPTRINDVIVGKNSQGVIYISVYEEGRPEIAFPLLPSEYTEMYNADGSPFPVDECSRIFAAHYGAIVIPIVTSVSAAASIEKSNRPFDPNDKPGAPGNNDRAGGNSYGGSQGGYQRQGGGSNFQRQGGGGGGYQNRQGGGGFQRQGGGGYQGGNRGGQGGGGFNRGGQGGGGGYQNRGGGNNYQGGGNRNFGGGQGGGQQGGGNQGGGQAPREAGPDIADDNIPF